jgi:hypothetical protein
MGLAGLILTLDVACRGSIDFGPLFHEFHLTLSEGARAEAMGPLFSYEERDGERTWSWTPLLSYHADEGTDSEGWDLAYPILTYDRYGNEYRFQIGQLLSFSGGENLASNAVKRFTLFPFYFQQRASRPELNYTAVFPAYGRLRNRLFRDEISFVLWPCYVKTIRGRAVSPGTNESVFGFPSRSLQGGGGGITTYNYFYPIFHVRHGERLKGWQVWPLAGWERKGITYQTNSLDELEVIGGHRKRFLAWPLFIENELDMGTSNPRTERSFFPLYSGLRSPNRDSSTYLWPLFTVTDDRENHYREFDFLGPLFVVARGPGKTANRVWPLFSRAKKGGVESAFYFWPIYRHTRVQVPPLDRRRTRICFFLYSDVIEEDVEAHKALRHVELFPLFTARRDREGNARLQVLAVLEPFMPGSSAIERNYSLLWSLWRSEKNGKTGATSQSFLWNLYRRDTTRDSRKCSLLFGMFQYQSTPEGKHMRLFYVPLGRAGRTRAAGVQR